jgi:hypothetical protein
VLDNSVYSLTVDFQYLYCTLYKAMIYFIVEAGNTHCSRLLQVSKRSIQKFYDRLRNIWLEDLTENPLDGR